MVSKDDKISPERNADFRRAFEFGLPRTLYPDVEYGTAIGCVEYLSRTLSPFAMREPSPCPARSFGRRSPGVVVRWSPDVLRALALKR